MHAVDELLALYLGRDPLTRKYILSAVGRLPPGLDSDTQMDFLWREVAFADPIVRHQARRETGRALPGFLRHEYGLTAPAAGVWSSVHDRANLEAHLLEQVADTDVRALVTAGMELLSGAVEAATHHLDSPSHLMRQVASLLLGRVQTRAGLEALCRKVRSMTASFGHAAALAELSAPEAHEVLLDAVREWGTGQPDLIMLLAAVPLEKSRTLLASLADRTDAYGRMNVAQSLARDGAPEGRELLGRLIRRREGWVSAYALDALLAAPVDTDLPMVTEAYRLEPHEFIKVQAVKVAGFIPAEGALSFLEDCLASGSPRVQAAALEALARQRPAGLDTMARPARRLLESPLLRARVNAMLVLARSEPGLVADAVRSLLLSEGAVERMEGAFVLGYLGGKPAVDMLETMATSDSDFPVQIEAVKGLARQPVDHSLGALAALAQSPDPSLASLAARALSRGPAAAQAGAKDALARALRRAPDAARRRTLLCALGALAARQDRPASSLGGHIDRADPQEVLGALEGLKYLGDGAAVAGLPKLLEHPDPAVRSQAVVASFLAGQVGSVSALEPLLGSQTEEHARPALAALLEIAVLLPQAMRTARFSLLRGTLQARTRVPGSEEVVLRELSGADHPVRARRPHGHAEPIRAQDLALDCPQELARTGDLLLARYARAGPGARSPRARQGPQVEEVSYLAGLPGPHAPTRGRLRGHVWLLVIAVALAIPIAILFSRGPEAARQSPTRLPPPAAGRLRPVRVKGEVAMGRLRPGGKPAPSLRTPDSVGAGDGVVTAKGAEVELADRSGNSLWLGPESAISIADQVSESSPSTTPPAFVFLDPAGDVFLDFRHVPRIEIVAGTSRLLARTAAVRVRGRPPALTAAALAGQVSLQEAGRQPRDILLGETVKLEGEP